MPAQRGDGLVDVLVIGGGNAALCAALMAREAGASVLLLEASPREWRGGNSQHTRNLRCMHDAPQDVLVDAYPEEEYWQDLLKVTGGATDEALARLVIRASSHVPAVDAYATACASSRRCRARCTPRAPTRSSSAAARRWSTPTTAAPSGSACRCATTRRCDRLELRDGRFEAAFVRDERVAARTCVLAAGRLRVQPRVVARGVGPQRTRRVSGRQLSDPRHALQHRRVAEVHARRRRRPGGRCDAGAHGGDRRARAAVRRRHLHAHRLRVAGHRGQPRRRALLRRGRGLLAQALRDLGPAGRTAARADRLFDHRRQGARPLHAAGVPRRARRHAARTGARLGLDERPFMHTVRPLQRRPCGPARSTTPRSTTATPRA